MWMDQLKTHDVHHALFMFSASGCFYFLHIQQYHYHSVIYDHTHRGGHLSSPFFDKYSLTLFTICTYTVDKENSALMFV